jgi:MFS family permease
MTGLGIGEIIGGLFIGYVVDKFGTKTAIVCNFIIIILMNAITLAFI